MAHQPGQAVFKAIMPEEIEWKPLAAFSPSVGLAVVVGQLRHKTNSKEELYEYRTETYLFRLAKQEPRMM